MALRILAIEPYGAISHRVFLEGLRAHSRHEIEIDVLPARKWKWRMRTSALHFAPRVVEGGPWDLLFVSDFVNLAELLGLLPVKDRPPAVVYFHENQLTYPLPDHDERDYDFTLDHLYSILAAKMALFNSRFHRDEFVAALPEILALFPDMDGRGLIVPVEERSKVLGLGTDVIARDPSGARETPIIVWNHRWEQDKNPEGFVEALMGLDRRGVSFRVRFLGERFRDCPPAFENLEAQLGDRVEHVGFVPGRDAYLEALAGGDIVVSTAHHEFFGLSTLEAIRCGLYPVVPRRLAYPELIPQPLQERFLYDDGQLVATLETACRVVQRGEALEDRRALIASTDRFLWEQIAPKFDRYFEEACD